MSIQMTNRLRRPRRSRIILTKIIMCIQMSKVVVAYVLKVAKRAKILIQWIRAKLCKD